MIAIAALKYNGKCSGDFAGRMSRVSGGGWQTCTRVQSILLLLYR